MFGHHPQHGEFDDIKVYGLLWQILKNTQLILGQEKIIMADLTAITAQVTESTTVEQSAVVLIQGLAAQIAAAGTDPVALAALTTQLNSSAASLAAAVAANTPAAPPAV